MNDEELIGLLDSVEQSFEAGDMKAVKDGLRKIKQFGPILDGLDELVEEMVMIAGE